MDSQSVKTTATSGKRGYDAVKKTNGHERHILVDNLGLLLVVLVIAAACMTAMASGNSCVIYTSCKKLCEIWFDDGYCGCFVNWMGERLRLFLAVFLCPKVSHRFVRCAPWRAKRRRLVRIAVGVCVHP